MTIGRKLAVGAAVVACATAWMAYVGASASWQYYLTVDECRANAASLCGERLRVSGIVLPGSLRARDDRGHVALSLVGADGHLEVRCSGPVPDNLTENMPVVVEGRLSDSGILLGNKVLTQCAGKYQSQGSP